MSKVFASNGQQAMQYVDGFLDTSKQIPDDTLQRDFDCVRTGTQWTCIPVRGIGKSFHLPHKQEFNPWVSLIQEIETRTGRSDLVIVTY
jgi:hypothetical protein